MTSATVSPEVVTTPTTAETTHLRYLIAVPREAASLSRRRGVSAVAGLCASGCAALVPEGDGISWAGTSADASAPRRWSAVAFSSVEQDGKSCAPLAMAVAHLAGTSLGSSGRPGSPADSADVSVLVSPLRGSNRAVPQPWQNLLLPVDSVPQFVQNSFVARNGS
jgi:hypothetical protein